MGVAGAAPTGQAGAGGTLGNSMAGEDAKEKNREAGGHGKSPAVCSSCHA